MGRHVAQRARPGGFIALAALAVVVAICVPSTASVADPTATPAASPAAAPAAQETIDLGTAGAYSVLTSAALTSAGGSAAGAVGSADTSQQQAQSDLITAYNAAAALTPTALISGDLGGRVITPGIYHADAALAMSSAVTLDALGNPDAVFIFQVGAALNTTAASHILLANGARAARVFWQVLGAVTTGAGSTFVGTILGNAAITAGDGTTLDGRALTQNGAITLSNVAALAVPDVTIASAVSPPVDVEAGDAVVFSEVIHNSGNVAVALSLAAGLPAGTPTTINWPDGGRQLPPGQSVSATSPYSPSLADAAARAITANAVVTATPAIAASFTESSAVTLAVYPTPVADTVTTTQSTPITFNVLANDAGAEVGATLSRAPLGAMRRLIGGASGPVPSSPLFGSVSCSAGRTNTGECTYQPAGSFIGVDSFDYSLSQGTRSWNVRVNIRVTAGTAAAPTARAVRVVATSGGAAVTFDPTANSTDFGTGSLEIASVAAPPAAVGSLSCTATLCTFTPSSFTGVAEASYTDVDVSASGERGTASQAAKISIFVDPPARGGGGFVAAATTQAAVTIGRWSASTAVTAAAGACTSGRPSTTISWQASQGTTSWAVQRRTAGSGSADWITVATLPANSVAFTDSAVGEGNPYEWRVRPDLDRWAGTFSAPSAVSSELAATTALGC